MQSTQTMHCNCSCFILMAHLEFVWSVASHFFIEAPRLTSHIRSLLFLFSSSRWSIIVPCEFQAENVSSDLIGLNLFLFGLRRHLNMQRSSRKDLPLIHVGGQLEDNVFLSFFSFLLWKLAFAHMDPHTFWDRLCPPRHGTCFRGLQLSKEHQDYQCRWFARCIEVDLRKIANKFSSSTRIHRRPTSQNIWQPDFEMENQNFSWQVQAKSVAIYRFCADTKAVCLDRIGIFINTSWKLRASATKHQDLSTFTFCWRPQTGGGEVPFFFLFLPQFFSL